MTNSARTALLPVMVLALWPGPACAVVPAGAGSGLSPALPALAGVAAVVTADERGSPDLTDQQQRDIPWLTSLLESRSTEMHARSGAALRLMLMDVEPAHVPLKRALRSAEADAMKPVVIALNEVEHPPPALLEPAVHALAGAPESLLDDLSSAVARYNEDALRRVAELVHDIEADVDERLGPIHALGAFRTRAAAVELMALLDEGREEPEAIVHAACLALARGTGLPYGPDPQVWRDWWQDARDQPQEEWFTTLVERLSDQISQLEQKVQHEQERAASIERRLVEGYRDLFPRLSLDEQIQALPGLLDDSLAAVRHFALDRVSRLLRDSVRLPDDLQHRLADRLGDSVPEIRLQAARLLDQMNYDKTGERVAGRLVSEENEDVVRGLLDILSKRPTPLAIDPLTARLEHASFGEPSARVLWEILGLTALDESEIEKIREHANAAIERRFTPAHARLVAYLADDPTKPPYTDWLDDADPEMRHYVAEAFARRDLEDPLLDRSADEVIYPHAVRVLARNGGDLSRLRMLLALRPPNGHESLWRNLVLEMTNTLPPQQLLEADGLLSSTEEIPTDLRVRALSRAEEIDEAALDDEQRLAIFSRLARLLLRTGQADRALAVISRIDRDALSTTARQIKFEAALRTGDFDRAAELNSDPAEWISMLETLTDNDSPLAVSLREQIKERFDGRMQGDLLDTFERLSERLPVPEAEAEADDPPA